jgi:eukaryotic-like serine/threonine-protein kinase
MQFSPGTRLLDRYVLEERIGHGGMSLIYRARDERSGKVVAVKQMVIADEDSVDTFKQWFRREIKALMVLDHPGIPRLLDHSADAEGDPFVVIEYLHGFDLDMAVGKHGAMPEGAAVLLAVKLLAALAAAHEQGIIHRDVKPANIFLCFNGRALLLDFGLARSTMLQSGRTLAGALNTKLIGTPQYFAPEQIQGGVTLSAASDLYSLGSSLYFALSGKHAFTGDGPLAVIQAVSANQRRPLSQSAHWLRPETIAFVEQLMAARPANRPKSAADAIVAAEALLRFFPDAEALLRRYVLALERNEKPPAPVLAATIDVAKVTSASEQAAPMSQTMITTTPSATVVATSMVTTPASTPVKRRLPLRIGVAATVFVIVAGGAFWLTWRSTQPKPMPQAPSAELTPLPEPTPTALPQPTVTQAVPVPKPVPEPEPNDPPRPKRAEPATGMLNLQLKQWAEVLIDGKSYGRKQLMASLTLPEGTHEIEVRNDRYGSRRKRITVKKNQELTLQVDFLKDLP